MPDINFLFSGLWAKFSLIILFSICSIEGALADNCSAFNIYKDTTECLPYGDIYYAGALFTPAFSAGLAAQ
ncbi:hypothetical protein GBE28_19395 [Salmonella enterica]|nr:hypothetical protein [Salmonella enterica]